MNTIKPGFKFKNEDMELTVIDFYEDAHKNVAVLERAEDGMYITVRDLTHSHGEFYYWHWGHYFSGNRKSEALEDFESRKKDN